MFADSIRKLRKARNLSQETLSAQLGIAYRTYGSWERGEREPDFQTLCAIADYFGVSTDELLGRAPFEVKKEAPPEKPDGVKRVQITIPQSASEEQQREALEALVQQMVCQELDRRNSQP